MEKEWYKGVDGKDAGLLVSKNEGGDTEHLNGRRSLQQLDQARLHPEVKFLQNNIHKFGPGLIFLFVFRAGFHDILIDSHLTQK